MFRPPTTIEKEPKPTISNPRKAYNCKVVAADSWTERDTRSKGNVVLPCLVWNWKELDKFDCFITDGY